MAHPQAQQFVLECIKKKSYSGPVIDLGAGDYSIWYRGLFDNVEYITLDITQNQKKDINIIDDIQELLSVRRETYGVALLLETLEHLRNPFTAFEKISQIIRPGGMFICTTVAVYGQHKHPGDYWRFLPDGLRLLCEQNNLEVFHEKFTGKLTQAPCYVAVGAIKKCK